jgi:glyoxylase I family protein
MIVGLDHVSLLVQDLEVSLRFYQQGLGLSLAPRPELGFDGAWLHLGGGVTLHLLVLPNPDFRSERPAHAGRDRHVALVVEDIALAKQQLIAHNISFTLSRSGRASIFCRDPDANGVELMQRELTWTR